MIPRVTRLHARVGQALSSIAVLFLLVDSLGKLFAVQAVVEGSIRLGYPAELTRPLGVILLTCVVLHLVPRTSALGAILLTGYLGGAVATHLRVGSPVPTHVLFPVYAGGLIWAGLALRRPELMRLLLAGWPHTASTTGSVAPESAHLA